MPILQRKRLFVAKQQISLFSWVRGKDPLGNAIALAAGVSILLILSPVIVAYMLYVKFGIPETLSGQ